MARDAGDRLAAALTKVAAASGVRLSIDTIRSTRWASATFAGARHALRATAPDSAALAIWLAAAPEQEFAIRGELVADLAIDVVKRCDDVATIVFAVLTVEER